MLVVDDDDICRFVADELLGRLGLTAELARDGSEALAMSATWPYVAVFMDCEMPEVDGYCAAKQLRRGRGMSRHALVIAMTSHSRAVCIASGMDHHLAKPLKIDSLRAECRRLGLLPRTDTEPREPADPVAADTPLLKLPKATTSATPYEVNSCLLEMTVRLPELYRAVNAVRGSVVSRIAGDLRDHAAGVGAVRIADLCDRLSKAGAQGSSNAAAVIEPQLRQAITDTANAIVIHLENEATPTDPPAPGVSEPTSPVRGPIRVAIADDDPFARGAIGVMLECSDGIAVVGDA
ncbi:MAG: response regulator, partial [Solirubrobacteraceae bacterium]